MSHKQLYSEIEPFQQGRLQVSELHELYFEQAGNPNGVPVVFLHGGPGGGISPMARQFFDPDFYRIILFDQRGAGKSTPHASLDENTTWDLVADMEKLRKHLGVDQWAVFGGSWGSTLALVYAINHPKRVTGLMLRGIFLCRPKEVHWLYQDGASRIYPDQWEEFVKPIPEAERHHLVDAYHKRLTGSDQQIRLQAAKAWAKWEASIALLVQDSKLMAIFEHPEFALAFAGIECHYFFHNMFMDTDSYILENIESIQHIPCEIVQGRYDSICPPQSAWDLHKSMPQSKLNLVTKGGHASSDPEISSGLVQMTENFKAILS